MILAGNVESVGPRERSFYAVPTVRDGMISPGDVRKAHARAPCKPCLCERGEPQKTRIACATDAFRHCRHCFTAATFTTWPCL